jgi:hypothetical protein
MKRKRTRAERDADNARTDEILARLRGLLEKAQAEIDAKRAQKSSSP